MDTCQQNDEGTCGGSAYYASTAGDVTGSWLTNNGTEPSPTVTADSCEGGGGATTTTSTLISVEQSPNIYFFGIFIFFLAFFVARSL